MCLSFIQTSNPGGDILSSPVCGGERRHAILRLCVPAQETQGPYRWSLWRARRTGATSMMRTAAAGGARAAPRRTGGAPAAAPPATSRAGPPAAPPPLSGTLLGTESSCHGPVSYHLLDPTCCLRHAPGGDVLLSYDAVLWHSPTHASCLCLFVLLSYDAVLWHSPTHASCLCLLHTLSFQAYFCGCSVLSSPPAEHHRTLTDEGAA